MLRQISNGSQLSQALRSSIRMSSLAVPSIAAMLILSGVSPLSVDVSARRIEYREVTIPAGTTLPLRLTSSVASDASHVEDAVHAQLRRAIVVHGIGALPAGTAISGFVTEATRSARVKGRARIGFRFNTVTVHGDSYRVSTSRVVREAAGTKKKDATKIAVPAAAGAIIGAIADGKKGAAIGSAVGGGGGTAVVMSTRGDEVRLGRGAVVAVRLLQPLTVRIPRG